MLNRVIAAVGTWEPPSGFRITRANCTERVGRDEYDITIELKKQSDVWYLTIRHEATLKIPAANLRDMMPDPKHEIHRRLTDMFTILSR